MTEKNQEGEAQTDGEMSVYRKSALSVVSFKTVYDKNDVGEGGVFYKPAMAHQIFGDSESIFGYRSVSISVYYLHNSCNCYVRVNTSGPIEDDNLKPDNIMEKLEPWLPNDFCTEQADMLKFIEHENHSTMFGKVIDEFKDTTVLTRLGKDINAKYKITKPDISSEEFQQLHSKFETYIVWYIDGANSIDLTDSRWLLYYVYEEFEHPDRPGEMYRSPIAFCSVYKFFLYPEHSRARISQFFVLPSHQQRGIGSRLYEVVISELRRMDDIVDITVEEPTETFQKIRDTVDCLMVHKRLTAEGAELRSGKTNDVMKSLKICGRQQRRLYDLLSGSYAKERGIAEYRKFSKRLRDRIAAEVERGGRVGKRFKLIEKSIFIDQAEKGIQIESEHKKYLEDIENSIERFWNRLNPTA